MTEPQKDGFDKLSEEYTTNIPLGGRLDDSVEVEVKLKMKDIRYLLDVKRDFDNLKNALRVINAYDD